MKETKIIFLDFDGVLNNLPLIFKANEDFPDANYTDDDYSKAMIGEEFVQKVNQITDATGADIVLSTSWRRIYGIDLLREWLKEKGLKADVIGETPTQDHCGFQFGTRGGEILEWMAVMDFDGPFVILDDLHKSEFSLPTLPAHFVQTKMAKGLTDENVEQAIKILNEDVESD